jgi:hydroxyacylglutathione hydrolase
VIDPARKIGLGLAYSTPSMEHLLNVPAGKISIFPDQPNHFLDWLRLHHLRSFTAEQFAPRAVFGQYMQSALDDARGIEHLRGTAVDCRPMGGQFRLKLADGRHLTADTVVLATGNFASARLPGISRVAEKSGAYCHSPWEPSAYAGLPVGAPVTLIGAGLTAVDVLLRLRELGHHGVVTMMSRNGVLPFCHAAYPPLSECVIEGEAPESARELLHAVHRAIRSGLPWRAVVDSLRGRTNELWLALPLEEQRRFRRHLQRRWDVVRHRMAPPVANRIERELAVGSLMLSTGKLLSVKPCASGASVTIRAKEGGTRFWQASRVFNCTGPDMDYRRVGSPLLDSLFAQGLITAGPLGGGLWSNEQGGLRAQDGTFSAALFNIGPGRQGVLLESIAVPELRTQAVELAEMLNVRLDTLSLISESA